MVWHQKILGLWFIILYHARINCIIKDSSDFPVQNVLIFQTQDAGIDGIYVIFCRPGIVVSSSVTWSGIGPTRPTWIWIIENRMYIIYIYTNIHIHYLLRIYISKYYIIYNIYNIYIYIIHYFTRFTSVGRIFSASSTTSRHRLPTNLGQRCNFTTSRLVDPGKQQLSTFAQLQKEAPPAVRREGIHLWCLHEFTPKSLVRHCFKPMVSLFENNHMTNSGLCPLDIYVFILQSVFSASLRVYGFSLGNIRFKVADP